MGCRGQEDGRVLLSATRQGRYNPGRDTSGTHRSLMTDPLRFDRPSTSGDVSDRERDARIEELLLTGLDRYFAGQYDLAINVWTRVLFLDRGHASARAYIERARNAISERQREADELFHTGAAALHRGDHIAARQLLTSALDRGASGEEALALLHRLDRLEVAGHQASAQGLVIAAHVPGVVTRTKAGARDRRIAWVAGGVLAGILLTALGGYVWLGTDPLEVARRSALPPPILDDPLPVPAPCEVRLLRAQALVAKGRLHEALALLEQGDPDQRHRAGFDSLRATVQRQLLEAGRKAHQVSPSANQ
jgi:tetratricopeptide (TPR) repeat protein